MTYRNKSFSSPVTGSVGPVHHTPMMPPSTNVTRRQDSKKCYNITTIGYTGSPEYIINTDNIFDGKIGCCLIPRNEV